MAAEKKQKQAPPAVKRKRQETLQPSSSAKQILQSMLMPDEKIIRVATISSGIYWKGLTMLVVALLVTIKAFPLGIFLLLVTGIMMAIAYLTKRFLLLAASDKRIFIRSGVVNLDILQMRFSKVESVEVAWSLMGQMLGYSNVVITGTGSRVTVIPFVADAVQFREAITKILLERDEKTDD